MGTSLVEDWKECGCSNCMESLARHRVEARPDVSEVELFGNRIELRFYRGEDPEFSTLEYIADRFDRDGMELTRSVINQPVLVLR